MSNWNRWPSDLNDKFAEMEHPERIVYPNLNDGSPLVVACDHSGEHAQPEFRVLSFLVTTYKSVAEWDPLRSDVRSKYLSDERRMSFKALNDVCRINAFFSFLDAASQLNGLLACIGVEKGFSFPKDNLPLRQHEWTPDTLNKLVEISVFAGVLVDGLRTKGQPVHWITDDDSTVSTEKALNDTTKLMGGILHRHPDEKWEGRFGIASQFDDNLRAEDLVAIPDLAAGAYSETLSMIGKRNIPRSGSGPMGKALFPQIKSSLISMWRSGRAKPLKHMNAIIRPADNGQMLVSFGSPFLRMPHLGESTEGAPILNSKWRRSLENDLNASGIDPKEVLKSIGIDV